MVEVSDKDRAMPSLYDYFYYDFIILKKAFSMQKEVFEKQNEGLLPGYVYFIELCIGKIMQHVEDAPGNEHVFEIVNWGRFDLGGKEIQELRKEPSFKQVFDLNDIRRDLANLRYKLITTTDSNTKKELKKALDKAQILNDRINSQMTAYYKAQKVKGVSESDEKGSIFHWFMVTHVYEPPRLFFSTMTDEIARSYIPRRGYLEGFKRCVFVIMDWLTEHKHTEEITKGLAELNKLIRIHEFYSKMHGTVFKGDKYIRIFETKKTKWSLSPLIKNRKLEHNYQLNVLFRGREIKAINVEHNIIWEDRDVVQRLFIDALLGGIVSNEPKVELYEFAEKLKVKERNGYGWEKNYTYAIYLPMHGTFSDGSSWLIFPKLDIETNWEPSSDFQYYLANKMKEWKHRVIFRKYTVKSGLLDKYIADKDHATILKLHTEGKFNDSKSLLAEFLAYFYLWHRYRATLVEFHKEGDNTDVDVVGEDAQNRYVVQAKNSFTINRKKMMNEVDSVVKHFLKIEKTYVINGKSTNKILFVVDWAHDKDLFDIEDWDSYMENTYVLARRALSKYDIELIIYSRIKFLIERQYGDFARRISNIFDFIEK